MQPRYFKTVTIQRPTILAPSGDVQLGAPTNAKAALWRRSILRVTNAEGEVFNVHAMAWVPPRTDVLRRDRLTDLDDGQVYEVMNVIKAFTDRGQLNHIGLELRDAE